MSRFLQEVSGELGDFWKRHAEKEAIDLLEFANQHAVIDSDGAVQWNTNNRYIMDDVAEKLEYAGFSFSREATKKKRAVQDENFFREMRSSRRCISVEERCEMESAFEKGTEVVDIITGQRVVI